MIRLLPLLFLLCSCSLADRAILGCCFLDMAHKEICDQIRHAIPVVSNRGLDGRYKIAMCPVCGQPPINHWEGWDCDNGHKYETTNQHMK